MRNEAIFAVFVGGSDITLRIRDVLQSIRVSGRAGSSSDTATIVLDDSAGNLAFPAHNAVVSVLLGTRGNGFAVVFTGTIDEVGSAGGRSGRTLEVIAKGLDTSGKAKEPQQRHFDDMTIKEVLTAAGEAAGVTDVRVDPGIAGKVLDYEHMDDESFVAFGERLAKEHAATFTLRNDIAVMVRKNGGVAPSGEPLPPVLATYGENLHAWDVKPYLGRPRYKKIRVRYYDQQKAKHDEVIVETDVKGSTAQAVGNFTAKDEAAATEKANSLKAESERGSGSGRITIEGNPSAQPEATCLLIGARAGIDGAYIIEGVDHSYDRSNGFTTSLTLAYPL